MKKFIFLFAALACITMLPSLTHAQQRANGIRIDVTQDPDSLYIMLSDTVYSKYRHGKYKSINTQDDHAKRTFDGSRTYHALLTQSSTNAPTATIYRNTLVGAPVITRDSIGTYKLTKAAAFTSAKTTAQATINTGTAKLIKAYRVNDSTMIVRCEAITGIGADLTGTATLEICVWPN